METKKRIEMIFCIAVIWAVAIVQGYALLSESGEEKTLEAFKTLQLSSIHGSVEVSAPLNKLYLDQEEKKNVLIEMAAELGIEDGYQLIDESKDDTERMLLRATMGGEKVEMSITNIQIPIEDGNYKQNQYVYMTCDIENEPEKLLTYKTLMEKILKRRGLKPNTNLNFDGEQRGNMSLAQKQRVVDKLFLALEATEVEAVKEDDLYTVYGYSDMLKESIAYGENEINLNMAFSYNEMEEKTIFYLAMPYIKADY